MPMSLPRKSSSRRISGRVMSWYEVQIYPTSEHDQIKTVQIGTDGQSTGHCGKWRLPGGERLYGGGGVHIDQVGGQAVALKKPRLSGEPCGGVGHRELTVDHFESLLAQRHGRCESRDCHQRAGDSYDASTPFEKADEAGSLQ